jgi:hypothetical protein
LEFAARFPQRREEFVLPEFFGEPRQFADGVEIVWFQLGIWILREFRPGSNATGSENSYGKPSVGKPTEFFIGADVVGIHFGESRLCDSEPKLFVQEQRYFVARIIALWIVVDARIFVAWIFVTFF